MQVFVWWTGQLTSNDARDDQESLESKSESGRKDLEMLPKEGKWRRETFLCYLGKQAFHVGVSFLSASLYFVTKVNKWRLRLAVTNHYQFQVLFGNMIFKQSNSFAFAQNISVKRPKIFINSPKRKRIPLWNNGENQWGERKCGQ